MSGCLSSNVMCVLLIQDRVVCVGRGEVTIKFVRLLQLLRIWTLQGAIKLLRGCQKLKMPFIFHCDAAPVSIKAHLRAFKNIKEVENTMKQYKTINFVSWFC